MKVFVPSIYYSPWLFSESVSCGTAGMKKPKGICSQNLVKFLEMALEPNELAMLTFQTRMQLAAIAVSLSRSMHGATSTDTNVFKDMAKLFDH